MHCYKKLSANDLVAGLLYISMIFVLTTKRTFANPIYEPPKGWRTSLEPFRLKEMEDAKFIYGENRFLFSTIIIKYIQMFALS